MGTVVLGLAIVAGIVAVFSLMLAALDATWRDFWCEL